MPEVPVNGQVLVWARTIRGLKLSEAAELLEVSVEELGAYESGSRKPLVGFLRKMSDKYQINFTSLLMPEPLPIKDPPTDYRKRGSPRHSRLSIDAIVAREEIQDALEVFEDVREESPGIVPRLVIGRASLRENPEVVAARERRKFNVSVAEQQRWHSLDDARRQWRRRVEARGVFTYMVPLPAEELSGFSLFQDNLAAICINDREPTEGAKIFTLFHEYCHLLLRKTGISDENSENAVERFCNEFAASFLIPRTALVEAIGNVKTPYEFTNAEVQALAKTFRVSNRATALRLEKTGLAPDGFYRMRTAPWDILREKIVTESKTQPSAITIRIKRNGRLHTQTVLQAVKRRAINTFDASQLIGLQPTTFSKIEAALG
jgi:Zn-dependent peptidase ImmA (M78 family)